VCYRQFSYFTKSLTFLKFMRNINLKGLIPLVPVAAVVALALLLSWPSSSRATLTVSNIGLQGDTNITVDTNGTLGIGTASATAITIGQSGLNVSLQGGLTVNSATGIGTTTPGQTLTIQGAGANDLLNVASSSGISDLYVTSAGGVGIGTTTPSGPLEIVDSSNNIYNDPTNIVFSGPDEQYAIRARDNSHYVAIFGGSEYNTGGAIYLVGQNDTNSGVGDVQFALGGASATTTAAYSFFNSPESGSFQTLVQITEAGLFGIGTTSPVATLAVKAIAGSTKPFVVASSTGTQMLTVLPSGNVGIGSASPISSLSVQALTNVSPLYVASSSGTSYMVILSNGNVGIGTSTPATTLSVAGGTNPTIRIGAGTIAGCLELVDSSGNSTINYLTATGGVLSATTTKPSTCQ